MIGPVCDGLPSDAGEPLALHHAADLDPLLAALGTPLSEYRFANLYLFRAVHAYRWHAGQVPHIRGITYDGVRHAMPLVRLTGSTAQRLLDEVDCLYPIDESTSAEARQWGFKASSQEADSDYLYDAGKLAALSGALLKPKRLQARTFARLQPRAEPLSDANLVAAHAVLDGWLADVGRPPEETDAAACREALEMRALLGLEGLLVRLENGEPVACLLAGHRRADQRVVHFAKGRRAYPGAYPWMFAHFAASAAVPCLNFEQDLGKPGFRQAKRALGPVGALRKYRLRRGP